MYMYINRDPIRLMPSPPTKGNLSCTPLLHHKLFAAVDGFSLKTLASVAATNTLG